MSNSIKVWVTGAGGFVGKALSKKLLELGFDVHAITRRTPQDLRDLGAKIYSIDISIQMVDY